MESGVRWWHGGAPGLRVGDLLTGGAPQDPDGQLGMVYVTSVREYARLCASECGRGDLYRVEPVGDLVASTGDALHTVRVAGARVLAVVERAVLLTPGQRRRLYRLRAEADGKDWRTEGKIMDLIHRVNPR